MLLFPKSLLKDKKVKKSTCLQVFCHKTLATLKSTTKETNISKGTTLLISKVVEFWKTTNLQVYILIFACKTQTMLLSILRIMKI